MRGERQLTRELTIHAPRDRVWAVVADSRLLPEWAPPVKQLDSLSEGSEGVGTTRVCQVEFGGRKGTMTERCVEFDPPRRAGYVVDDDNLGFGRMFADYGFTISIENGPDGSSIARTDTFYTPRNPLFALMNAVIMRRRFSNTVDELLSGLKRCSESRNSSPSAIDRNPATTSSVADRAATQLRSP
jgi:uncharacterized protein YndB with AHSA1/START domain